MRLAAVVMAAASLGACSTFDNINSISDLNPFGPEKYKTKIEQDVPPSSIYDQGLAA